jgi:predicted MPP superfamily phosphohydrolase
MQWLSVLLSNVYYPILVGKIRPDVVSGTRHRDGLAWWPDLICLTGNFITCNDSCDLSYYRQILRRLSGAAPAFACLGNHDGGLWAGTHRGASSSSEVN